MLCKSSKSSERVTNLTSQVLHIICVKLADFIKQSVGFDEETSHFKCERACKIVRASCMLYLSHFFEQSDQTTTLNTGGFCGKL